MYYYLRFFVFFRHKPLLIDPTHSAVDGRVLFIYRLARELNNIYCTLIIDNNNAQVLSSVFSNTRQYFNVRIVHLAPQKFISGTKSRDTGLGLS